MNMLSKYLSPILKYNFEMCHTLILCEIGTDSLKGSARTKRGKGIPRRVLGYAPLPGSWQNFLRIDENKGGLSRIFYRK